MMEEDELTGIPPPSLLSSSERDEPPLPPSELEEFAFGRTDDEVDTRVVANSLKSPPPPSSSCPYVETSFGIGAVNLSDPRLGEDDDDDDDDSLEPMDHIPAQQIAKRATSSRNSQGTLGSNTLSVDGLETACGEDDGSDNGKSIAVKFQRKEERANKQLNAASTTQRTFDDAFCGDIGDDMEGGGHQSTVGGDLNDDDDDEDYEDEGDLGRKDDEEDEVVGAAVSEEDGDDEQGVGGRGQHQSSQKVNRRRRAKGRQKRSSFVKILEGMYIDFQQCLRSAALEDCFPLPKSPKECRELLLSRQGRTRALRPVWIYFSALRATLTSKTLWRSPVPVIAAGLLMSLFCEASLRTPRYNTVMILLLVGATEFPHFPLKSVRPQITISVITGLTVALDVFFVLLNPLLQSAGLKLLIAATCFSKVVALWTYLRTARNTLRARKYLVRRVRLFGIPLSEPRRIMRDVRARFMALALLQGFLCVSFAGFFLAAVTDYGYSKLFVSSRASGVSLPTFLLLKAVTSGTLFVGLALDCDWVLVLAYFGCLGWCMRFVKDYTRRKRIAIGGWPYPFFYNETRHSFFLAAKAVDVLWGVVGWVTVGTAFGSTMTSMESSMRTLLVLVVLMLTLSDIWCPLLLVGVSWLLRRKRSLEENEVLSESDDSELDELEIRDPRSIVFPRPRSKKGPGPDQGSGERRRRLRRVREARDEGDMAGPLGLVMAARRRRRAELRRADGVNDEIDKDAEGDSDSSSSSSDSSSSSGGSSSDSSDISTGSVFAVANPLAMTKKAQFSSRRSVAAPLSSGGPGGALGPGSLRLSDPDPITSIPSRIPMTGQHHDEDQEQNALSPAALGALAREATLAEVLALCARPSPAESLGPFFVLQRSVGPDTFSTLWGKLRISVAFMAQVSPVQRGAHVSAAALSTHLGRRGFFVVALKELGGGVFTVFAFAAGARLVGSGAVQAAPQLNPAISNDWDKEVESYALFEFSLTAPLGASNDSDRWSLGCSVKCSHDELGPEFVALLLLGDLYELQDT